VTDAKRVVINKLATGVPGLDEVLGGGLPEYSFNLIAGAPGTGKTTLAQQILFNIATPERPGLFFTVLGEPPIKMMRYQQQFSFFKPDRVGEDVHFLNLSEEVLENSLDSVLNRIVSEVERANPSFVVVDSFRTVVRSWETPRHNELDLQHFVQRLALRLTSWETTSFLIGEFGDGEAHDPVFTVADGVLWLMNELDRNSSVRKLRVTKVRGQPPLPGLHTVRIADGGVEVFPRTMTRRLLDARPARVERQSTGIAELDEMMCGGIPAGDSILVTGPTGTGKTILATQFASTGVRNGEKAVIAVFEEHPNSYIDRARSLGMDLGAMVEAGNLEIMYLRPLDLSVDEALQEIRERVVGLGAKRVIIDSLSGFEAALAPSFRPDFRESFYRMMTALTALGVTVLATMEIAEANDYLRFSPYNISFLTDDIVALRFIELDGELRKVLCVIKMRGSDHSRALRAYDVTETGIHVRQALREYRGIITGVPELRSHDEVSGASQLDSSDGLVLEALQRLGQTTVEALAADLGLEQNQVTRSIDRLMTVRYVRPVDQDGRAEYRAMQPGVR
jgi:circadian clock protein KaiC